MLFQNSEKIHVSCNFLIIIENLYFELYYPRIDYTHSNMRVYYEYESDQCFLSILES